MAPSTNSKPAPSRILSIRNVIQARATDAAFVPSVAGDNEERKGSSSAAAIMISIIVILAFVGLMWVAITARRRIIARRNELRLQRARVWTIAQKERSSSSVDLKGAERTLLMKERDSLSSIVVPEYLSVQSPAPPPKAHTTFGKKLHLLTGVFTSQAPTESAPSEKQRFFPQYSMLSDAGPWTKIELQSPIIQGDDNQRQPPQVPAPVQPVITRLASIHSHKAEVSQSYQVPPWEPSLAIPPSSGIFPPPTYSHISGLQMTRNMPPLPSITISPATPATPTALRAVKSDE